jgi:hypothetical protein
LTAVLLVLCPAPASLPNDNLQQHIRFERDTPTICIELG